MVVVRLADEADRLDLRAQRDREAGIVGGAAAAPARHAERRQLRPRQRRRVGEEAVVGRVGTRPAALDIVDAEPVQLQRDRRLVDEAEIHALGLVAVAPGRVEEPDSLANWPAPDSTSRPSGSTCLTGTGRSICLSGPQAGRWE